MVVDLFNWIEKELIECVEDMLEFIVGYSQDYGYVNKVVVWVFLLCLYFNVEIYVGQNKYIECIMYVKKVIEMGYQLEFVYVDMFKVDNYLFNEMIFLVCYEGDQMMIWGGMIVFFCWGVMVIQEEVNVKGVWQGVRVKLLFYNLFFKESGSDVDICKVMFCIDLIISFEIIDENIFQNNGIFVIKYFNVNKDGMLFFLKEVYVDFLFFCLGEIYLMYVEVVFRGGQGGDRVIVFCYVNDLCKRVYSDKMLVFIFDFDLILNFIIDE